jgi:hypothetical protein
MSQRSTDHWRENPLNELVLSRPSEVMSRYSTSAKNFGSTHDAIRIGRRTPQGTSSRVNSRPCEAIRRLVELSLKAKK